MLRVAASISLLLLILSHGFAPAQETSAVSPDVERDVQRLMNVGLPRAERLVREAGEFHPFGAVQLADGRFQTVGTTEPGGDTPADVIYEELETALRAGAGDGSYRSVATYAVVELGSDGSTETIPALRVSLEHRDGHCIDVFFPVLAGGDTRVLGEALAAPRTGAFFDTCR